MRNIFKIIFVIIGTLIGAGFASGQEMYLFFYYYGMNGIFGIFISSIMIGLIIYSTLTLVKKYNIENYKDFMNIIVRRKSIENIFNILINVFLLITFFVMIAGFGAYFEQALGINHFIGSSIVALLCFLVFQKRTKGVITVNSFLIPILIVFISLIGILNIIKLDIPNYIENLIQGNREGWLISAILYSSYNSILLIPTLITLRKYLKNTKSIIKISIISTIIIVSLSLIIFLILGNINNDISNIEMPTVYVINEFFTQFIFLYGFIIVASIFTTSISLGTSFLQNYYKSKSNNPQGVAIMCITAVLISNFGFSNLVEKLYPILGYLGLAQIILIIKKIFD